MLRKINSLSPFLVAIAGGLFASPVLAHYGTPYGDYNNNGVVDAADYVVWRGTLNSTTNLAADGNRGGAVTSPDYDYWRARFGNVVQPDLLPNPAPASFTNSPWLEQSGVTQSLADDVNYGEGITIGIVDTGINSAHLAFAGHLSSQGACYIYCDGGLTNNGVGSVTTDGSGHGTAVAAIAAGGEYNGVVGVAAKATVLPIKVYPSDGSAVPAASTIAYGARLAADRGASVINISSTPPHGLSTTDRGTFYRSFTTDINYAASQNAVTVFAGGDESQAIVGSAFIGNGSASFTLSAIQRMIFVGGVDSSNNLAAGSNMPGTGKIISSIATQTPISDRWIVASNSVVGMDGSSLAGTDYAAAQVAGAIALLETKWPQIKDDGTAANILLLTATDLGAPGTDSVYGHGLLNIPNAFLPLGGISTVAMTGAQVPIDLFTNNADGSISVSRLDPSIVNLTAYDSFGRDFPIRVAPAQSVTVPEPATFVLLMFGLLAGSLVSAFGQRSRENLDAG